MQDTIFNPDTFNYDSVPALQQKRTLAFVNHFILTTVQFLNNFAKQCEQKLMQFENRIEKLNATVVLLETRLSSIPEVNSTPIETKETTESPIVPEEKPVEEENPAEEEKPEEIKPEYMRFVKMVQVGVPLQAVKLKMSTEGLDPNELDKILKN